jgi:hypothetical protein
MAGGARSHLNAVLYGHRAMLEEGPMPGETQYRTRGVVVSMVAAAMLGVAAIVLGVIGNPNARHYDAPLFPLIRTGIEGMNGGTLLFLAVAGLLVASVGEAPPLLIGLSTMAAFPLLSVAEALVDPKSHNLLPIEWFLYLVETIPGIAGAYLGWSIRRRRIRRQGTGRV